MFSFWHRWRESRPYYFLHIPKTAGTSLIHLLTQRFPPEQVCPAQIWSLLLEIPREQLGRYRLFLGHLYHYLLDYLDRPAITFTFLRDPLERALSHYEHILRHPGHYFHEKAKQQGSLCTFLDDPETLPMIANFQTRALALDLDPVASRAGLDPAQLRALVLEKQLESVVPPVEANEELLRVALERLRGMAFVGIVEDFDSSVRRLFATLGWRLPRTIPTLNVSSKKINRTTLLGRERQLLHQHLQLDYELYARACASQRAAG
jgi:hypothetical protein